MAAPMLEVRQWWGQELLDVKLFRTGSRVTGGLRADFRLPDPDEVELLVRRAGSWVVRTEQETTVGRAPVVFSRGLFRFEAALVDAEARVGCRLGAEDLTVPLLAVFIGLLIAALSLGFRGDGEGFGGLGTGTPSRPAALRLREVTLLVDVTPTDARPGSLHQSPGASGASGKRAGRRQSAERAPTRKGSAGLLGALSDPGLSALGSSALSEALTVAAASLQGVAGFGEPGGTGLGARGGGIGAGGTAVALESTGKRPCGGHPERCVGDLGAKREGGIGTAGGDPIALGALDRTQIEEVVRRHMNQIRYCYQRALQRDAELAGKLVVAFTIAPDGSVAQARAESDGMDEVDRCIAGLFLRMGFPEPEGGGVVVVRYPFLFDAR